MQQFETTVLKFRFLVFILISFLGMMETPCLQLRKETFPDWLQTGNRNGCQIENHPTSDNFPTIQSRRSICTFCLATVRKPSQLKQRPKDKSFCSDFDSKMISQKSFSVGFSNQLEIGMSHQADFSKPIFQSNS